MARPYVELTGALQGAAAIYRSAETLVGDCGEELQSLEQKADTGNDLLRSLKLQQAQLARQRCQAEAAQKKNKNGETVQKLQQQENEILGQIRQQQAELRRIVQDQLRVVDRLQAMVPRIRTQKEQCQALEKEFDAAAGQASQSAELEKQIGARRFGANEALSAAAQANLRSGEHRQGARKAYHLSIQYSILLDKIQELCQKSSKKAIVQDGALYLDTLSPEQRKAIYDYTTEAPGEPTYKNINKTMRDPKNHRFLPGNKERALAMHQALSGASLPAACTVYRGTSSAALASYADLPDEEIVGKVLPERAFLSTSLNKEDSFGGEVKLCIEVPAGTHGVYIGSLSAAGDAESEVLFDFGQMMRVTGVERTASGVRTIHAKMLT